jgi:arsenate reductase (glutaredoxin)
MKVTIYHNPKCGTSRGVLEIIRSKGIEPKIVEYLKTPLTRAEIQSLVKKMGVPVRDIVRAKEALYAELKLEGASDAELLDAMAAHPILLNRPIVVTPKGIKLCRPSEQVRELLLRLCALKRRRHARAQS